MNKKITVGLVLVIAFVATLLFLGQGIENPHVDSNHLEEEVSGSEDALQENLLETRIGQGASKSGVTVIPREIVEDSRCPADVQCIQAGTVRLRSLLSSALGEGEQIFELGQPITTEAEQVTLVRVEPEQTVVTSISPQEYRFYFEVIKR